MVMIKTLKVLDKPPCAATGGNLVIIFLAALFAALLLYSLVAWHYTAAYRSKLWLGFHELLP